MTQSRRSFLRSLFQGVVIGAAVCYLPGTLKPPTTRRLKVTWTMESAKDLYAEYGLDENGNPCSVIDREQTHKDILAELDKEVSTADRDAYADRARAGMKEIRYPMPREVTDAILERT